MNPSDVLGLQLLWGTGGQCYHSASSEACPRPHQGVLTGAYWLEGEVQKWYPPALALAC